jgi:hypothetical protein
LFLERESKLLTADDDLAGGGGASKRLARVVVVMVVGLRLRLSGRYKWLLGRA